MHKKFITTVAATSIFIAGMVGAPAHAGSNDTQRVIGALIGIALVGAAIHDSGHDGRTQVTHGRDRHRSTAGHNRHRPVVQNHSRHQVKPRHQPARANRNAPHRR